MTKSHPKTEARFRASSVLILNVSAVGPDAANAAAVISRSRIRTASAKAARMVKEIDSSRSDLLGVMIATLCAAAPTAKAKVTSAINTWDLYMIERGDLIFDFAREADAMNSILRLQSADGAADFGDLADLRTRESVFDVDEILRLRSV